MNKQELMGKLEPSTTLAGIERIEIQRVTEALVVLYMALRERNHCPHCEGEGIKVLWRFNGLDCVACSCARNLQLAEAQFASVFELADRHKETPASAALYSILTPGLGLCRCLDAVQRLHAAATLREDCPTCRGMGRSFRYDQILGKTLETRCVCVTVVEHALLDTEKCYQAALDALLEWRSLDVCPPVGDLLELLAQTEA